MSRTIICLFGLVFAVSLISGVGFSQSPINTSGERIHNAQQRQTSIHEVHNGDLTGPAALSQLSVTDRVDHIPVFDIVGLNVDQKLNGYLIRIRCSKQPGGFESWLRAVGNDTWLYITIADVKADVSMFHAFKPTASVRKVLIFESATSVQITFRLKGRVNAADLILAEGGHDILVAVPTPGEDELALQNVR